MLIAQIAQIEAAAVALASVDRVEASALRAIVASLRIDLVFLGAHPEGLLAALWARCAWHEEPDAARFSLPPRQLDTGWRLQQHALGWLRDARGVTPGAAWLRTLRPPPFGLAGALVAERRGVPGRIPLAVADDGGEVLLAPAAGAVSRNSMWTPRDGGLRDAGPGTGAGRFVVDLGDRWNAKLSERGSEGPAVPLFDAPDERRVEVVAFAPDDSSLALLTTDMDLDCELHVLSLPGAELRFRTWVGDARDVSFSARGSLVVTAGDRVQLFDARDGAARDPLPISADRATASEDGRFVATLVAGAVQLWDFGRPLQRCPLYAIRAALPTVFSPSGTRLVSGTSLYDGRSGVPTAQLSFERGEYLEGGPPENWFFVSDRRIVALDRGVHSWETATGIKRCDRNEPRYAQWHEVAYRTDGLRYAVRHRGESAPIAVYRVDDGEPEGSPRALLEGDWTSFFPLRASPSVPLRTHDGCTESWDESGAVIARLPHAERDDGMWVGHPDGQRFAAPGMHLIRERLPPP